ncbi:MAG TPA: glycoside hydrolase family 125 protein [Candidatus Limnocylindria bacterium]|nr:glycoside hydrolase family 125 protein [Candidatus Limnocylindria bacterium]
MRPTPLDPRKPYKPLDVGNGIVAGTLTPNGRWLSLGVTHPIHGRVVLTDTPAFPDASRGDQPAARRYRADLASASRHGFGLSILSGQADAFLVEDSLPLAVLESADERIEVLTLAPRGRPGALQIIRVAARDKPTYAHLDWQGTMRLARAAYTQLTPGGALPPAPERTVFGEDGRVLWIDDRELGAAAAIAVPSGTEVPADMSLPFVVAIAFGDTLADAVREAVRLAGDGHDLVGAEVRERRAWWVGIKREAESDRPIRRATAYALDCAAARAGDDLVAVLADHEILPLVWTRDAYYVCRMLLELAPRDERVRAVVDGFLRWLFEAAERPAGWWPRASLANGTAKDPVFQLDQQLYPFLLLEDHARITGERGVTDRYATARDEILSVLLARRTAFGLIAADETPADDPSDQPFHFSSHVLLWRVLRELDPRSAAEVHEATRSGFTSSGRFAYAVSGERGAGARHYHDANDLPTVFAPGWGFCRADDPIWRATIDFAWSDANEGHFAGRLGGLGSLHTRHPWPLGDLQEIVLARVLGDGERERRGWERLDAVETWDGMLPEAYDENTGAVASRHWFAWPAALRALLALDPMLRAP